MTALRTLNEEQLDTLDADFLTEEMWRRTIEWIAARFPEGRFSFLDVGGGAGRFCDALLERFPHSRGTLVDNARILLDRNAVHPRKTLLHEVAADMAAHLEGRQFDLIFFNWVLHHLVSPSYRATRREQEAQLGRIRPLLRPRGQVCVLENLYDGMAVDALSGWLIHWLTSRPLLAPILRKRGANTAGCGVCFLSRAGWEQTFHRAGLRILRSETYDPWPVGLVRRLTLHIGSIRVGQFWLTDSTTGDRFRDVKAKG